MSCKRLSGAEAQAVQPIVWRRVGAVPGQDAPAIRRLPPGAPGMAPPAEWENEIAKRERMARDEGYRQGETAAMARLAPQIEEITARAAGAVRDLMQIEHRMRRHMEEDLVKLATMIARRVLHRELTADPEALLGIVRAALARVSARDLHRVRVSPPAAPLLEKFLAGMHLPQRIEVVADPALERGALALETTRGQLDASVETQLEEIDRGFADMMRQRG
ncbi:MAG: FliH/SctL family protein [Bryobacteraceae bacterium]